MQTGEYNVEALGPLINLGAVGAVLAWFLFRSESRMERLESAVDRMTRAMMLELASRPDVSPAIKRQAAEIVEEIDLKREGGRR
jgi:hypothetical protein